MILDISCTEVWLSCFSVLSRPGPLAHNRSSSHRHGSRSQVWPSTAPHTSQLWLNHPWKRTMPPQHRDTAGGGSTNGKKQKRSTIITDAALMSSTKWLSLCVLWRPPLTCLIFDPYRSTTQARTQQERKKVKARRGENRNRFVESCSFYLWFYELIFALSSGFEPSRHRTDG